jgi:hypothetical protein
MRINRRGIIKEEERKYRETKKMEKKIVYN